MLQYEDSIHHATTLSIDTIAFDSARHEPLTPRKVQEWLPENASPAQQDSIVQVYFKPSPITWSNQPDTLTLPGLPARTADIDINTFKIYTESFFTGNQYYHPELPGGRQGQAGEPIPYSIMRDDVLMTAILACLILTITGFSLSRHFLQKQVKNFFRIRHKESQDDAINTIEHRFQMLFSLQTCLLLGLISFFYVELKVADLFIVNNHTVVAIFAAVFFGYVTIKSLLYQLTGNVFFTQRQTKLWMHDLLFILNMEGVLIFPLLLLQTFFSTPINATITGMIIIVCGCKLLTSYKLYIIFFRQKKAYLQNILYLCTLEIVPIAALIGILSELTMYLKVSI